MKFNNNFSKLVVLVLVGLFAFSTLVLGMDYKESPLLNKMVKEGKIPPLEERLPANPEVVEPLHNVGNYGGVAHVYNAEAPSRPYTAQMLMGSHGPFKASPQAKPGVPNVFKGYDVNDDFTVWTFHLRKGLKWSDGTELNAQNFYLYWKLDRANSDINPSIGVDDVTIGDNYVTFYNEHNRKRTVKKEVIDDYTIKYTSNKPYPLLINHLSHPHSSEYEILPMHFLKQFHPEVIGEEVAKKLAEKAGFDTWFQLYGNFSSRQGQQTTVQVLGNFPPTLSSYVCVKRTQTQLVFERNPYYYKVDTEGSQLPYIDKIVVDHVAQREIINGKIISGDVDFEGFMTQTPDIPLYKQYEEKAGYRTELWNFAANSSVFELNYTYEDEVVSNLFQNRDFRIALSLAIDRNRINNDIMFGKARPIRMTVLPETMWHKPEYETKYSDYDPERAKKMLDDLGVVDVDGDGWREDSDGNDISWTVEYVVSEAPREPISELVIKNWQEIGLKVDVKQDEANLGFTRVDTDQMAMWIWHGDARTEMMWPVNLNGHMFPAWIGSWDNWWFSDGESGVEPPENAKDLYRWFEKLVYSTTKEEMIKWGQKMLDSAADNMWVIGTTTDFPHAMIVKNDLKNFPTNEDGPLFYIWSTWWTNAYEPTQFYFEARPEVKYEDSLLPGIYPLEERLQDPVERALKHGWL